MPTFSFDDEPADQMEGDGYDTQIPEDVVLPPEGEERPVPGYVPQAGDMIPGDGQVQPLELLEEDYGAVMDQVDRRMKVANYYRLVLDGDLFAGDESSEAKLALSRIRKYVREELELLLGMRKVGAVSQAAAQVVSPFTEDEVVALKELARVASARMKKEPTLKPIEMAKPATVAQLKPVTAAPQPSAPVQQKRPQPPAQAAAKPQPQPQRPPVPPAQPPKMQPQQGPRPPADPRIPEKYRNDPTAKVVNGKVFVQARDDDGNPVWFQHPRTKKRTASMKDVTPVAQPTGVMPVPMPPVSQFNQMSHMQAAQNLSIVENLAKNNPNIRAMGAGLLYSLAQPQQNPDDSPDGGERPF